MPGPPHPNFSYANIYRNAGPQYVHPVQRYSYVEPFANPPRSYQRHYATQENYATQEEHAFVMFYAPWCGHCTRAKPAMKQAMGGVATEYADYKGGNFKKFNGKHAVIMVNCDEHPELAKKHGIRSFPTFKHFKGVKDRTSLEAADVQEYNGGRGAEDFDAYMNSA